MEVYSMRCALALLLTIVLCGAAPSALHAAEPLRIYLDADRSSAQESTTAIERGIKTALAEVHNTLLGRPVELTVLDHRGNAMRSLANLKAAAADPNMLAVYCGQHSPPVLTNLSFINDSGILLLNPWAAAGPITRPKSGPNWVFRLSVDDTKAGKVIINRAIAQRGFTRPALLLEKTGWGFSNEKIMVNALAAHGASPAVTKLFNWGISVPAAKIMLRDVVTAGADVIIFVGNAPEGIVFCQAMLELSPALRRPIISHWGITGGDFPHVITPALRAQLDIEFLQTRFSFLNIRDNALARQVFAKATALFADVATPEDITAPTGFVHAYDLTRLLIEATKQVKLAGKTPENIAAIRQQTKHALEHLHAPVQGLIKTYTHPFTPYSPDAPDAHEALGAQDLTFGQYGRHNEIILIP